MSSVNSTPTTGSLKLPEIFRLEDDPRALEVYYKRRQNALALFAPPEDITISEWAEKHRIMPKGTTDRPGPFHAEKFQVEMMDAVLDPRVHEAIEMVDTTEVPDHHVLDELQRGYKYKDRLLRPAMVRVARNSRG